MIGYFFVILLSAENNETTCSNEILKEVIEVSVK